VKLTEAIKKYFGRYDETEDESETALKKNYAPPPKKKKKKKISAGSYFKKKRTGYEKALEEADNY